MDAHIPPCTTQGLTIFAGAGCSMSAPASLPSWYTLNDAILEALWSRVEETYIPKRFRQQILPIIKQRRAAHTFPPDYQAQLMAERAGLHYFELLSVVDSKAYNAIHYYIALLAREGIVKAVFTTNFDTNFEKAFDDAGVPFGVHFDEEGFHSLAGNGKTPIPIVKIHGSCSSPTSLIDTRKQRLQGRSAALEQVLSQYIENFHVVFTGFSGADFDDNANYLGFRAAASTGKGFTYLRFPGSPLRKGMQELIRHWGPDKTFVIESDSAHYFQELLDEREVHYDPFVVPPGEDLSIGEKLAHKINSLESMDALNMLTALTESFGDEITARFLYDKTWKNRLPQDYEGEGFSRFLLNYGRSYVFNLQDRLERAESASVPVFTYTLGPPIPEDHVAFNYRKNPAYKNLFHVENVSAETTGLIALTETFLAVPDLFSQFPESFVKYLRAEPTALNLADIAYYYSHHAMIYSDFEKGLGALNHAILSMEAECDEPRQSRLLSRSALIKFRIPEEKIIASGYDDAVQAYELANQYHEPVLLALSELALATHARVSGDFQTAFAHIQQAMDRFSSLIRIPQYVECAVERLKILMLGFSDNSTDKEALLELLQQTIDTVNPYVTERAPAFEPEYCYLVGMIYKLFTDLPQEQVITWFTDSITLAEQYKQENKAEYYRETCAQLGILDKVTSMIAQLPPSSSESSNSV